jgi:signal transduction histidine kinase
MSAAAKGLSLDLRFDDGLPEKVCCDAVLLRQVLNNLLSNATKFTDQGGITLRVARTSRAGAPFLLFCVGDTGIGIPREAQALVFEKFRQADQSLTRAHQGTGLGLALAKQIVELMGGAIALESIPGSGTSIEFTLPLRAAQAPQGAAEPFTEVPTT